MLKNKKRGTRPFEIRGKRAREYRLPLARWPIIHGICAIVREETALSIGERLSSHEIPNAC